MTDRLADRPEPVIGAKFTMPDGSIVTVHNWARDHTGIRVNGVPVWDDPELNPRLRAAMAEQESSGD